MYKNISQYGETDFKCIIFGIIKEINSFSNLNNYISVDERINAVITKLINITLGYY
jgi:hypothetical protein